MNEKLKQKNNVKCNFTKKRDYKVIIFILLNLKQLCSDLCQIGYEHNFLYSMSLRHFCTQRR